MGVRWGTEGGASLGSDDIHRPALPATVSPSQWPTPHQRRAVPCLHCAMSSSDPIPPADSRPPICKGQLYSLGFRITPGTEGAHCSLAGAEGRRPVKVGAHMTRGLGGSEHTWKALHKMGLIFIKGER